MNSCCDSYGKCMQGINCPVRIAEELADLEDAVAVIDITPAERIIFSIVSVLSLVVFVLGAISLYEHVKGWFS